ncbi:MAG TPA: GDP-mannose 4,6-dehydratase [Candidatus Kapabacteria bacterium]|jgi:dTDP-glucose 4,6-dehydratase|nr:GDP-mannose 4,6-dehydratase [Candidatus Kapabacteria bacterium]
MNLLVTGGAGFIGANFAHYASQRGHAVLIYDLLTYAGNPKNVGSLTHLVRGDIRSATALDIVFSEGLEGQPFDAVVNFAAESHVDRSISLALPFVETNVLGAVTLLEASRKYAVPLFIQISTDEVYGSIEGTEKFTHASCLRPSSAYSASKAAADQLLLSYHHTHGMDVRVTRCTNNYGRFQHPEKFIPMVLTHALNDRPITIFGDGHQVRDWIFVDDHCEGILRAIEQGVSGHIYHFAGPGIDGNEVGISNIELVHLLLRILSKETGQDMGKLTWLIQHVPDRPGHDRRYALDWSQSKSALRWSPTITLEKGLQQTVRWWLANQDWWNGV